MLYTFKNGIYVPASVLDIDRYLFFYNHIVNQKPDDYELQEYIDEFDFDDFTYSEENVSLFQLINDEYRKVTYVCVTTCHEDISSNNLQIAEKELICLLKDIDTSKYANEEYFNTNYEQFYGEDTNEVTYKSIFVACAILLAEKLNISLVESMDKCNKIDIYGNYMQAEPVEMIVENAIKYRERFSI